MTDRPALPPGPWQWPEEHWRRLVNRVRAGTGACGPPNGRAGRAARWPCRSTAITRRAICATAANRSAGSPGARTAAGSACRALKVLQRHGVKASFYVPGGDRAAPPTA